MRNLGRQHLHVNVKVCYAKTVIPTHRQSGRAGTDQEARDRSQTDQTQ